MDDSLYSGSPIRSGQVLCGRWQVERLLGTGATSLVFEARHRNGKRVALKVLRPELASNQRILTRFLREGYLANRVDHPGAVSVLDDATTEDGVVFLVMEHLRGETLAEAATRTDGKLEVREVLRVAEQALEVLVAAHAQGIVHRDIKPRNIFLADDGKVKILDFGLARLLEDEASANTALSHSDFALGTPAFMSPEQARGNAKLIGPRTDLWGVGASMFTLLSGRPVREGDTVNELLIAAATEPVQPISVLVPDLPPSAREVVDRALRMHAEERWPDAAAMLSAVRTAQQEMGAEARRLLLSSGAPADNGKAHGGPTPVSANTRDTGNSTLSESVHSVAVVAKTGKDGPLRRPALAISAALGALVALACLAVLNFRRPAAGPALSAEDSSARVAVSRPMLAQPTATATVATPNSVPEAPSADTSESKASSALGLAAAPGSSARSPTQMRQGHASTQSGRPASSQAPPAPRPPVLGDNEAPILE